MTTHTRRKIIQQATGAMPMPRPSVAVPAWSPRRLGGIIVFLVVLATVVAFSIGRGVGADASRQAEVAPVAPFVASTVTPVAVLPTPMLYPTLLAAFPDARVKHGYTLMCQGRVWEFGTVADVWAARRTSGYAANVCKCFEPRAEGQGYRECNKE